MGKVIPWTEEEIKILEDGYKNYESVKSISEKLHKSPDSIRSMASTKGFTKLYPKVKHTVNKVFWTDEEVEILKNGYANYESIDSILEKLPGRTRGGVCAKAIKLGLCDEFVRKNSTKYKAEYQSYDWCYQKIIVEGKQPKQIAEETGYGRRTIEKWAEEKFGLNNRTFKKLAQLSPIQRSIIIGGVLGDGHICLLNNSAIYIESHAVNQKDYLFWKYDMLKNLCLSEPTYYSSGVATFGEKQYNRQESYRFQTRLLDQLINIKNMTRYELIDELDEIGVSTHFLDDASRDDYQWQLCFGDWDILESDYYIENIKNKFGIEMKYTSDKRYAVTINKENSIKLDKIILRNIPNDLDIIRYKILKEVA